MPDPAPAWPNPGPRWIPYPNRFWRWRAVLNGWRDGHRGIGQIVEPSSQIPDGIDANRADTTLAQTPESAEVYHGPANTYEVPPFVSRFLQVAAWKVNLLGQEFSAANKLYERARKVEAERLHECAERISRGIGELDLVRTSEPHDLIDVDHERERAVSSVGLHRAAGVEDLEPVNIEDLLPVFQNRAGARAAASAAAANRGRVQEHQDRVAKAEATVETWRDNRHAAAQEYVQTCAEQAEWYNYMRTRFDSLAGFTRMIIDLYWSANRRSRRCLWRRIAQVLFGRWARRPFVSDPVTVSPAIETPDWVRDYAYLAEQPTTDPMKPIGEATRDSRPIVGPAEGEDRP